MLITYTGPGDLLDIAFYNTITDGADLVFVSGNSSQIVLLNPSNGAVTTITGTNLPTSQAQLFLPNPPGTVTGWSTDLGGATIASVQNIAWTTSAFVTGIYNMMEFDNDAAFLALLNLQPVTFDASGAVSGADISFAGTTSNITLIGSVFSDTLEGGAGNDTLTVTPNGFDQYDEIFGTGGNDLIVLSPGSSPESGIELIYDNLSGPISVVVDGDAGIATVTKAGMGVDTLSGVGNYLGSADPTMSIWGSTGNDSFLIDGGAESWIRVNGGAGDDSYDLTLSGDVRLSLGTSWSGGATAGVVINTATGVIANDGFGNVETLILRDGDGTLEIDTHNGNDSVTGSDRDERFILRGGNDTLNGGGGFDLLRLDRSNHTSGVNVDLTTGVVTGTYDGNAFTKLITGIEAIRGTAHNDTIRGSTGGDDLDGRNGNDLLDGRGGADTLRGGEGNDTLIGGAGNDRLDGGAGDDRIEVGSSTAGGGDQVIASAGNDTIVYTGVGASGGGWNEIVYANFGSGIQMNVNGVANTGSVFTASGTQTLVDVARVLADTNDGFNVFGSDHADSFTLNGGANSWMQIFGGRGSDSYNLTLSGIIRLNFSGSWYEWNGATEALSINLATGVIANDGFGNAETLTVTGSAGRLEIEGTRHADTMIGSARGEVFMTMGGNDTINGGGGFDTVRYDRSEMTAGVVVNLATGVATGAADGIAFTQSLSGIEEVRGTGFGDTLRGSGLAEEFEGRDGHDLLEGNAGADTLYGGNGNDTLRGGLDIDRLFGGDGTDTLDGGAGDDFIFGGDTAADLRDVIFGGDGHDSVDGGYGNDELNGGAGNDTLLGNMGADTLVGNGDNDLLSGMGGADAIFGNDGNDTLNGGFGFDRLNGGAGADRFLHAGVADHGSDWIQDYNAAQGDILGLTLAGALRSQLQVNFASTPNAGSAAVTEAFVIYRPTGQVLWALVDGGGQSSINVQIGGVVYDLLA